MTKKTSKELWLKILKPSCFGQWDCATHPNPNNPFFPPDSSDSWEMLVKSCIWAKKCATSVVGKEKANLYFPSKALKGRTPKCSEG